MKIKIAIAFVLLSIAAYAVFSAKKTFAPAEDLPKGAIVYAEFTDLPAFLQLWGNSELKEKYLESENFNSLKNRRLGLKLASRWQEFNEAAGFPFDLETVGKLAEKQAAIGIYDIGKLEFVFIAPVSNELYAATDFFQNKDRFEEKTLENGTSFFSVNVQADRGRQAQKMLFINVKNRFVLATSEQLLLQTVNNINSISSKNRLSDEPLFKDLILENSKPNLVSVWVNQFALNKDYYFKRYWLMRDASNLKNIRAGIFDVSMEENKLVERRRFLLEKQTNTTKLDSAEMQKMLSLVPSDTAFYQLRTASASVAVNAIFDCVFDRKTQTSKDMPGNYFSSYSFADLDDSEQQSYDYLNGKFDETIDETPEDNFKKSAMVEDKFSKTNLQNIFQAADPQSVLILTEPKSLPMPLFAEFRRAAVIKTNAAVNQIEMEKAIAQAAQNRIAISNSDANLQWKTVEENGVSRRELNLPMLGWEICYTRRGENLIVSNSANLLNEILAQKENKTAEKISESPIDRLTVINLTNKNENFDEIFGKLAGENSDEFFLGNVGSLLETISAVKTIEIESSGNSKYREEKITFHLE